MDGRFKYHEMMDSFLSIVKALLWAFPVFFNWVIRVYGAATKTFVNTYKAFPAMEQIQNRHRGRGCNWKIVKNKIIYCAQHLHTWA